MVQGSVTQWLTGLQAGDESALRQLWDHYCRQLVELAKKKLPRNRRRVADEEDIALSAFGSLCRGAREGRFPELRSRDNLWSLLVFITAQKVANRIEHELAQKRGGGRVRGHSALGGREGSEQGRGFDDLFGQEPGPATLAQWLDEYERLLDALGDPLLREIAVMRVEGFTVDEIATKLNRAKRTVARKLDLIRKIWLTQAGRRSK
jgi:DNA-directed RNA polymerase specialized sigma24 family protein